MTSADTHDRPRSPLFLAMLDEVREICVALPEVNEIETFHSPTWQAGKKSFAELVPYEDGAVLSFKADPAESAALLENDRFYVPKYTGHKGWLSLRLDRAQGIDAPITSADGVDWGEVEELIEGSYRIQALKRMLAALDRDAG